MQWTIENTQKNAKWGSMEITFPDDLDELTEKYGKDGAYNLIVRAFPVVLRTTNGSQTAADAILSGAAGTGGGASPYRTLFDRMVAELSDDKAKQVNAAIEFLGFSKTNFEKLLAGKQLPGKIAKKYRGLLDDLEASRKK